MDVVWCGLLLLWAVRAVAQDCGLCDCDISTKSLDARAVRPIKTRCRDGAISWRSPEGAIQLTMIAPFAGNFKLCFVVETIHAQIVVSKELSEEEFHRKNKGKRRVFNNALLSDIVFADGDGRTKEYCVKSSSPVVLFLEPFSINGLSGIGKVTLLYDIEKVSTSLQYTPLEECRPCSEEELLRSFCSSDFVVVGTMADVVHTEETSNIEVDVTQVVRQVGSHFKREARLSKTLKGTVVVPRQCGIAKGNGAFLFTGRSRLGKLTVTCAPYYNDWYAIAQKAQEEGRMECDLN